MDSMDLDEQNIDENKSVKIKLETYKKQNLSQEKKKKSNDDTIHNNKKFYQISISGINVIKSVVQKHMEIMSICQ